MGRSPARSGLIWRRSGPSVTLLPFGSGERVCLGKALAELEIRLMVVGLLRQVSLGLAPHQVLSLQRLHQQPLAPGWAAGADPFLI